MYYIWELKWFIRRMKFNLARWRERVLIRKQRGIMTDIAIEAFIHTIQSKEVYIIILGIVCIYYFDKIMKS